MLLQVQYMPSKKRNMGLHFSRIKKSLLILWDGLHSKECLGFPPMLMGCQIDQMHIRTHCVMDVLFYKMIDVPLCMKWEIQISQTKNNRVIFRESRVVKNKRITKINYIWKNNEFLKSSLALQQIEQIPASNRPVHMRIMCLLRFFFQMHSHHSCC